MAPSKQKQQKKSLRKLEEELQREEELLNQHQITDEDDDDDEDEEDYELDEDQDFDDDDDESILSDDEELKLDPKHAKEISDKAWGKRSSAYYEADLPDEDFSSDDELAMEEGAEVERLRSSKLQNMKDMDFLEDEDEEAADSAKAAKKKTKKKEQVGTVAGKKGSDAGADLKSRLEAEVIERDVTGFTEQQLLEIVKTQSPELLTLLAEFKEKLNDARNKLKPILDKVKNGEIPTNKGVSFLEMKYHLLLSYCTNICYYLLLKVNGKSVKDHPVIDQLVELRVFMEKIKPIEIKLKYQIDKLVRLATGAESSDNLDPLRFKPNPENMVDGDEDEEENDVYIPKKIAPVHYEATEKAAEKKLKAQQRILKAAAQSRLLRDLQEELSDRPEEVVDRNNLLSEYERREEEERTAIEEATFTRIQVTKKDKKKRLKKGQLSDEIDNLNDFGDLDDLEDKLGEMLPRRISAKKSKEKDFASLQNDDLDIDAGEEMYQQFVQSKKQKKAEREQAYIKKREDMFEDIDDEVDGKRGVNYDIMKSKGLTRKRKKEDRNPRVKKRMKFEKNQKKLKSIRPELIDKSKPYGGEVTGIKANVTKSIRFK